MSEYLEASTLPESRQGQHRIERFTVSPHEAEMFNLRERFNRRYTRMIRPGTYTRLVRGPFDRASSHPACTVVMSDTPAEIRDHIAPVEAAHGRCLIHGLGLGLVAEACLRKWAVTRVTVIERDPDVLALAGPTLQRRWGDRLELIQGDAMTWAAPRGARWGMVWHDIWDTINTENLPEMQALHRRYGNRTDWQGSWCRDELESEEIA